MLTSMATQLYSPEVVHATHAADNAALAQGAPVCFDLTEVTGGTTAKGYTVANGQAVGSFISAPSVTNKEFAGITTKAMLAGDHMRIFHAGACRCLVKNETGLELTLPVGTALFLKPGAGYLVPRLQTNSAGTAHLIANSGANPRAFTRVAATIATVTTQLVEVMLYPAWQPPRLEVIRHIIPGAQATITAHPIGISTGYGHILRVGFGLATGGDADALTLDVLIGAVSCLTTLPKADNDCDDPCQSLDGGTLAAVAGVLGAAGAYGLVDVTANALAPDDLITATITDTGSFVGTHLLVQVECLMY